MAVEGEVVCKNAAITSAGVNITTAVRDEHLEEVMEGWINNLIRAPNIVPQGASIKVIKRSRSSCAERWIVLTPGLTIKAWHPWHTEPSPLQIHQHLVSRELLSLAVVYSRGVVIACSEGVGL